ncbi:AAA family ATPase [Paenibacillus xylanilyticus]|uniref:AAA family ATPase n=1 Tax=Paenibacillus xylanilyticus TaxID=248903 RepID=UPI0039A3096B
MIFKLMPVNADLSKEDNETVYLVMDNWNDWFEYRVLHQMYYKDNQGEVNYIGPLKFGQIGMKANQDRVDLPDYFEKLSEDFFSLGNETSYYDNLNRLGDSFRDELLNSLNDIALDLKKYSEVRKERVTTQAVLRDINPIKVKGKFHSLAQGDSTLSHYSFNYVVAKPARGSTESYQISFEVNPNSKPPSNIHAIIGRNGVGKTHLLNGMIQSLLNKKMENDDQSGFVFYQDRFGERKKIFDNVIYVSFSPFDESEFLQNKQGSKVLPGYTYIGLKRKVETSKSPKKQLIIESKSTEQLREEFINSMWLLRDVGNRLPSKKERFKQAVKMLNSDPIFMESGIAELLEYSEEESKLMKKAHDEKKRIATSDMQKLKKDFEQMAEPICKKFSSGHSIVLLTISKLVEKLEERTLILLDEPETHLHPPLLSTLTRILSYLLLKRNGVGIVATHSPVVLQEVPRDCAWIYNRIGRELSFNRPEIETFGENINTLTKEVFSFEVTDSGFHNILKDAANKYTDYEEALAHFDENLGLEARAILRILMKSGEKAE